MRSYDEKYGMNQFFNRFCEGSVVGLDICCQGVNILYYQLGIDLKFVGDKEEGWFRYGWRCDVDLELKRGVIIWVEIERMVYS